MLDDASAGGSMPAPRCTWCSAELPSDHEATCPSCGATLLGDGDAAVPGLTAIDAEAILRNARAAKAKPRSRLLGWISGEYEEEGASGAVPAPGSLAPPPAAVAPPPFSCGRTCRVTGTRSSSPASPRFGPGPPW